MIRVYITQQVVVLWHHSCLVGTSGQRAELGGRVRALWLAEQRYVYICQLQVAHMWQLSERVCVCVCVCVWRRCLLPLLSAAVCSFTWHDGAVNERLRDDDLSVRTPRRRKVSSTSKVRLFHIMSPLFHSLSWWLCVHQSPHYRFFFSSSTSHCVH